MKKKIMLIVPHAAPGAVFERVCVCHGPASGAVL